MIAVISTNSAATNTAWSNCSAAANPIAQLPSIQNEPLCESCPHRQKVAVAQRTHTHSSFEASYVCVNAFLKCLPALYSLMPSIPVKMIFDLFRVHSFKFRRVFECDAAKPNSSKQMRNDLFFLCCSVESFDRFDISLPTAVHKSAKHKRVEVRLCLGMYLFFSYHYWCARAELIILLCSSVYVRRYKGRWNSLYRSQLSPVSLSRRAQSRVSFAIENSSN